ncbi:helix-turn-helix transcriptional regulator [Rhodocyclaceae bacterium SMB388]
METERIIRRREVEHLTGLARATIYHRAKDGTFPKPIKIGTFNVGWIESEVKAWIAERIAERTDPNAGRKAGRSELTAQTTEHITERTDPNDGRKSDRSEVAR